MNSPDLKTVSNKKIAGVILAAGSSSRMGQTKQLMPFKEKTLLGQVIENAEKSALHEVIVVLGHDFNKIRKSLDLFCDTKLVRNTAYLKGQSTSLIKGLENVSPWCDAAMFLLGDQPLVTDRVINQLIDAFETKTTRMIIPYFNGRRGNPVIIARDLFHRLTELSADTGARALFDEFKEDIVKVAVNTDSILVDVDTPEDYKKLMQKK